MGIILILLLIFAVIIGAVSGLVKGYAKTSFWGGTVIFSVLLERLIGGGIAKDSGGFAIAVMIATVVSLLVFTLLFATVRKIMNGKIQARRALSEYENHDVLEENETLILCAVDDNDKKAYKKLTKQRKKIKTKNGGWGVVNRILGALFGLMNAFIGAFIVIAFFALFVEFAQIEAIYSMFSGFLTGGIWVGFFGKIALDVIVISVLSLAIRSGYKSGISSVLSVVVVLGLVVAFAFASWNIANGEAMASMVNGLESGLLSSLPDIGAIKHTIAVAVTAVILFLLSLIVIIIVAIFLPKLVDKFRENKVFGAVDGVFGAIVFTVFILALMLVFGGLTYTLNDLPAMAKLNAYMANSYFADCLYSCNPLGAMFENLPLRSWFGE